ncbi:hypothetical protein M0811_11997 [Anaeramoeba ignava]|uniref:Uncharacterized protein n=1 Tax=Anaeramoeba ignava TaxID=1746090 RepID=A0A9Q0L9U2_ANAIG|nr:hypothetical protein M0811_11997 [Anaeramoeba ignava]
MDFTKNPLLNNSIYSQLFNSSQYPNISEMLIIQSKFALGDSFYECVFGELFIWKIFTIGRKVYNFNSKPLSNIECNWASGSRIPNKMLFHIHQMIQMIQIQLNYNNIMRH